MPQEIIAMGNQEVSAHLTEIYTLLCRAGLNKDYYGVKLSRTQSVNTWFDIIVAIGAAGSGISALTIWSDEYGKILWGFLTAVSAIFAVVKPILQLGKKVERLSRLFSGHSEIYNNMIILVSRVKRRGELTVDMIKDFENSELRFLELSKEDDPRPSIKLLQRCENTIRIKHPARDAWYPDAAVDPLATISNS